MVNTPFLISEALALRSAMELCDKSSSTILTKHFPVMNCKFASLLLAFHYLQLLNDTEITCVSGYAENMVSHTWLEIGEHVIDITGDQYNFIDDIELNSNIVTHRPYPKVHVELISRSYLYQLFERTEKLILKDDFSDFKASFVSKMKHTYSLLLIDFQLNENSHNCSGVS